MTVIDTRSDETYNVARLHDGLLWMTDNLRIGYSFGTLTLTSEDTDLAEGETFVLPKGTAISGGEGDTSDGAGWHHKQYDTAHIYNWYEGGYYHDLYTWYAATAGEGKSTKTSGDTEHSICSKGWRLPTSEEMAKVTSGDNASLNKTLGNFTVYEGRCSEDGCPIDKDSYGFWWSSTAYNKDGAGYLGASSSAFSLDYEQSSNHKGFGYSVRCVAREK